MILLVGAVLAVAVPSGIAYLFLGRPNAYQASQNRIEAVAASPSVGDWVQVQEPPTDSGAPQRQAVTYRWYVIQSADPEAVELRGYDALSPFDFEVPDLDPVRFDGPVLSVPRETFLRDRQLGVPDRSVFVANAREGDESAVYGPDATDAPADG